MENVGTAMIKFSESEINLLINSLEMSTSTIVPCVGNGEWKKPYEVLKEDLIKINKQLRDKKREQVYEQKRNNPSSCKNCED